MVRLSTTYDKDLKKKVFVVRGDEDYAKSTECAVIIGSITTGEVKGLKISSITINLYRTVGDAQLTLYDDDILLESWNISSSVHSKTLTNYYLGYGASHNLWAEYTPLNHQCLGCKSKKVTVSEEIPSSLLINYTKNSASSQVNSGADVSFDYTVKKGSTNVANNTPVLVYVDDDYVKTVNTSSGKVASTISDIADGRHTIKLEVDTSDTFYGNSIEFDVLVGYQVEIYSYPQTFINDTDNTVVVNVMDYNGEPVTGDTVSILSEKDKWSQVHTIGTGSVVDGVATINVTEVPFSGLYHAEFKNSQSKLCMFTIYTPDSITTSINPSLIGIGDVSNISVRLNNDMTGVPVYFKIGSSDGEYIDTVNGVANYSYVGTGVGSTRCYVEVGEHNESVYFTDAITYWTSSTDYSSSFDNVVTIDDGSVVKYSNYLSLRDILKTTGSTSGVSYGMMTFEPVDKMTRYNQSLQFTIAKKPLNVSNIEMSINIGDGYTFAVIPTSKLNVGSVVTINLNSNNRCVTVDDEVIVESMMRMVTLSKIKISLKFNTLNGGELYIKDLIYKKV